MSISQKVSSVPAYGPARAYPSDHDGHLMTSGDVAWRYTVRTQRIHVFLFSRTWSCLVRHAVLYGNHWSLSEVTDSGSIGARCLARSLSSPSSSLTTPNTNAFVL